MKEEQIPLLEDFLASPIESVREIAPQTLIYAPGGTRRSAALAGIEPWSREYVRWAHASSLEAFDLIFRHGVRHLISTAVSPGNAEESNRHSDKLYEMADWVLASEESIAQYAQKGWRVRILGGGNVAELEVTAKRLCEQTSNKSEHTLWWTVEPDHDTFWHKLLLAARKDALHSKAEAICALYGEAIPPATLYLAFGKPTASTAILPPLLCENLQCYWSQQIGYSLTEVQLRTILYDYAFLRNTWRKDKLDRAYEAAAHQAAWQEGPVLGLGMRLGPFWYPAPMNSPAWSE